MSFFNKGSLFFYTQKAVEYLGSLDVMVLNHASMGQRGWWEGTKENITNIHQTLQITFMSFVLLASDALPHLKATNGSIAVISSDSGKV